MHQSRSVRAKLGLALGIMTIFSLCQTLSFAPVFASAPLLAGTTPYFFNPKLMA